MTMATQFGGVSSGELRQFVERIENLETEKAQLMELIREVFAEAKSSGFDIKVLREIIKQRKMKSEDRNEHEELLDLYKHALGMIPSSNSNEPEVIAKTT